MRRVGGRVGLLLEPRERHPEDREEEEQDHHPREESEQRARRPLPTRRPPDRSLTRSGRLFRSSDRRRGHVRPAMPSSLNKPEIVRSANVAMMIVATTTTTPMADARPMLKLRNAAS